MSTNIHVEPEPSILTTNKLTATGNLSDENQTIEYRANWWPSNKYIFISLHI